MSKKKLKQILLLDLGIIGLVIFIGTIFYVASHSQALTIFHALQPANGYCNRSVPYPISPDLERAWSLLKERLNTSTLKNSPTSATLTPLPGYPLKNCVDIQYKDLSDSGAEGFFKFDPSSTTNDLHIYVDSQYRNYDDLLTAILLSHEFEHAAQFLKYTVTGEKEECVQQEIEAFSEELTFWWSLNAEEQKSLVARISQNPNANSAYNGLFSLLTINSNAITQCGGWQNLYSNTKDAQLCYSQSTNSQIREMVVSNPFYQQECASELQTPTEPQ